ncbi:MAG: cold shock and DUF1294 domain-containing protein [Epsilonproteobacteria bacterium]|nr:cold shock and DUF1294 domain-containing protein [Campylobacterota bacterium]
MQGKIINYNSEKGYGFIYSELHEENIFVHKSSLINARELFVGQRVEFQVKRTEKGLSATSVVAGAKQQSPYLIFGLISAIITIGISIYLSQKMNPVLAYLVAINVTTFLLYGYDKFISSTQSVRVPEWNLHGVALLGGSPAGLASQQLFRHKTLKGSFQLVYWSVVILQVGGTLWVF